MTKAKVRCVIRRDGVDGRLVVLPDDNLYRGEELAKFVFGLCGWRCCVGVVVEKVDGVEVNGGSGIEFTL